MNVDKKLSYIIDMDGILYHGMSPLPYAGGFIQYLNDNGRKYLLLTNCPGSSPKLLAEKLAKMNIFVKPECILTSGQITADFIAERTPQARVYLIGGESLERELISKGILITESDPQYVVVGYDTDFSYAKMEKATELILNGAAFICTNEDYTIPVQGKIVPHTGAISKSIEVAAGIRPVVIGKPEKYTVDKALEILQCKKEGCCIIGDRLDTDIIMGKMHDIDTYLVLTGVTDEKQLLASEIKPTRTFQNLKDLMEFDIIYNTESLLSGLTE